MGDPKTFWLGLKVKSTQGSNHDFEGEFFWILCLPPIHSERICTPPITVQWFSNTIYYIITISYYTYYIPYVHNIFLFMISKTRGTHISEHPKNQIIHAAGYGLRMYKNTDPGLKHFDPGRW